ncbi:MAG: hypothetical protein HC904_10940 [Blastochloris sp.]|nr:hypothetical protein [Blastochloris sp.]
MILSWKSLVGEKSGKLTFKYNARIVSPVRLSKLAHNYGDISVKEKGVVTTTIMVHKNNTDLVWDKLDVTSSQPNIFVTCKKQTEKSFLLEIILDPKINQLASFPLL